MAEYQNAWRLEQAGLPFQKGALEVRIGLSVIYQWFIRLYGKKKKIFFVRCRLQTRWSESLE